MFNNRIGGFSLKLFSLFNHLKILWAADANSDCVYTLLWPRKRIRVNPRVPFISYPKTGSGQILRSHSVLWACLVFKCLSTQRINSISDGIWIHGRLPDTRFADNYIASSLYDVPDIKYYHLCIGQHGTRVDLSGRCSGHFLRHSEILISYPKNQRRALFIRHDSALGVCWECCGNNQKGAKGHLED